MHAQPRRPFRILPDRENVEDEVQAVHIKLVPHACVACGELITTKALCIDCTDRAGPHEVDDPYDIIGGDHGAE